MSAEENLQRMKTLDDAWNAQKWEVFRKRHASVFITGAKVGGRFGTVSESVTAGYAIPRLL